LTWYFLVAGAGCEPAAWGCEDSVRSSLSLGSDAFCAGQMRRQELSPGAGSGSYLICGPTLAQSRCIVVRG